MHTGNMIAYVDSKIKYWEGFLKLNIMKAHEVEAREKAPYYIDAYKDVREQLLKCSPEEKKYRGIMNSYM